ncbi:MAG: hypothetical protein K6F92_08820 [Lachnospiraceae bacterium]|nr:hypothetical protein [Lachnospiraceae bacterium]
MKKLRAILIAVALVLMAIGICKTSAAKMEVEEGYVRQHEEENIADRFIEELMENAIDEQNTTQSGDETQNRDRIIRFTGADGQTKTKILPNTPTFVLEDYSSYGDDFYHSLTPEYASGEFKFVLEIPDIGLKRGVYGSEDPAKIEADLAMWMLVLMDTGQELGVTNIAIAGHDSLNEDLSLNRLVDIETFDYIGEGHNIYIYSCEGVYIYQIEEFFDAARAEGRASYGYTTDLDVSDLYIFTCGRDINQNPSQIKNHRYKDIIVHAVLTDVLTWREYRERDEKT